MYVNVQARIHAL